MVGNRSLSVRRTQVFAIKGKECGWYYLGDLEVGHLAVNRKDQYKPDVSANTPQIDRPKGGLRRQEIHVNRPLHDLWFMLGMVHRRRLSDKRWRLLQRDTAQCFTQGAGSDPLD